MSKVTVPPIRKTDSVREGTLHDLVKEITNLRYDRLVQFFDMMSNEMKNQSMLCLNDKQLSARLSQTSADLMVVSLDFQAALKAIQ